MTFKRNFRPLAVLLGLTAVAASAPAQTRPTPDSSLPPGLTFPKEPPSDAEELRAREADALREGEVKEPPPRPATAPTSQPVPVMAAPPTTSPVAAPPVASAKYSRPRAVDPLAMPASYSPVTSRSIFMKGSQDVVDHYASGSRYGSDPSTAIRSWPTTQVSVSRPEASLLFDGATRADDKVVGLVEDTNSHAIIKVSPGDRLARGVVSALSLNQLDYQSNGRTVHVMIGQNLDAESSSLASAPGSAGPAVGGSSSPGTSAGTGTGTSSNGGGSLLELMRKRRQQELSGK